MAGNIGLGYGLARGANAFMQSYMQTKMMKEQSKMQKHQIILQALYKNLEDENIPYRERAKIFDAIPGLLGIKMDVPLSQTMGLQDLLDKDVETQSAIAAKPAKEGTSAHTVTDMAATEAGLADTIYQQGTEATPAVPGRDRIAEKFGDMSPAKYKQLITTRQQDVDAERSLEFYRRKAEIDFELQQDSYKAQGYTRTITEGFNTDGEYVVLMGNASNDIKEVKMPRGFKPIKMLAKSGSRLPSAIIGLKAYYQNEINPLTGVNYTPEEAEALAAKDYKVRGDKMFKLTEEGKEATTQGAELRNTGEMPPSPAERAAREDRLSAREEAREKTIAEQSGILRDATTRLLGAKENLTNAEAAHQQAVAARDAWIINNGSKEGEQGVIGRLMGSKPDYTGQTKFNVNGTNYYVDPSDLADDEYKALNAEVNRTRTETSRWRAERDKALGDAKSAEQLIEATRGRQTKAGNSNSVRISQAQIETFRTKNANNARVRAMSDDEIRQLLMQNQNKWQP